MPAMLMISSVLQLPTLMSRSKGGSFSSCILILCLYVGTYLCVHHVVMNNTSLPWTTSPQLIQRKTTKTSPTKQLINFILPLADTVLGDSKYLRYRYVYLIVR